MPPSGEANSAPVTVAVSTSISPATIGFGVTPVRATEEFAFVTVSDCGADALAATNGAPANEATRLYVCTLGIAPAPAVSVKVAIPPVRVALPTTVPLAVSVTNAPSVGNASVGVTVAVAVTIVPIATELTVVPPAVSCSVVMEVVLMRSFTPADWLGATNGAPAKAAMTS